MADVHSAGKKPQMYKDDKGKMRVRMVPSKQDVKTEKILTPAEKRGRERIAKKLPMKDFKKRYGDDAMAVKMATATNIAKKKYEGDNETSGVEETKGAPKGYHFTRSGKLRKGDADVDGPGGKKLRADPLDKQRSKIPPLPEAVTYHGNPNKDDDARNAARRRALARQDNLLRKRKAEKEKQESMSVPVRDVPASTDDIKKAKKAISQGMPRHKAQAKYLVKSSDLQKKTQSYGDLLKYGRKDEQVEEHFNWKVSHAGKDVHVKAPHAGAAVKKAQKGFGNMDLTKAKITNLGKVGTPANESTDWEEIIAFHESVINENLMWPGMPSSKSSFKPRAGKLGAKMKDVTKDLAHRAKRHDFQGGQKKQYHDRHYKGFHGPTGSGKRWDLDSPGERKAASDRTQAIITGHKKAKRAANHALQTIQKHGPHHAKSKAAVANYNAANDHVANLPEVFTGHYSMPSKRQIGRASDEPNTGPRNTYRPRPSLSPKSLNKKLYGKAMGSTMKGEDTENVQELKKSTLGSYVKKASKDAASKAYMAAMDANAPAYNQAQRDRSGVQYMKSVKRQKGIAMATDKLTREAVSKDADLGENNNAPQTAAHRRAMMGVRHSDLQKDKPPFEGPYTSTKEPRKDKFGNVVKKKNIASFLAKKGIKSASKTEAKVDEISTDLKKRYIDKAKSDYGHQQYSRAIAKDMGADKEVQKHYTRKMQKRLGGIGRATATMGESFDDQDHQLQEMMAYYTIYKDGKVVAKRVRAMSAKDAEEQAYMKMGSASKYSGAGRGSFKAVKESVEIIEREDTAHHVAKTLIKMGVRHDTPEHEVLKKIPHALKKHGLAGNRNIQMDPDFHGDVFDSLSDLHKKKESVEEANDKWERNFKKRIAMTVSGGKKVKDYMKKKVDQSKAAHAKQDPGAVKGGLGPAVVDRQKAYKKAKEKGLRPGQIVMTRSSKQRKLPEETQLDEVGRMSPKIGPASYTAPAKELKAYAQKSGGMDKNDFMQVADMLMQLDRVNILQAGQVLGKLSAKLKSLDTSPREKILSVLDDHGHDVAGFGGYKMKRRFK